MYFTRKVIKDFQSYNTRLASQKTLPRMTKLQHIHGSTSLKILKSQQTRRTTQARRPVPSSEISKHHFRTFSLKLMSLLRLWSGTKFIGVNSGMSQVRKDTLVNSLWSGRLLKAQEQNLCYRCQQHCLQPL